MMFSKTFLTAALFACLASAARVELYSTRSCSGSPQEDFQNVACDTCISPAGDFYAAQVSEIGDTRWSINNEKDCTSASQVGQAYGDACGIAGSTAIKSVYVSC